MIASKKAAGARRRVLGRDVVALIAGVVLSRWAFAQNAVESSDAAPAEPETLDQIVVTGTMIHGARPTGSELVTLDRHDHSKDPYFTDPWDKRRHPAEAIL